MRSAAREWSGFTILEVVVAILLLTLAASGVAQAIGMAASSNRDARERTMSAVLAAQKLEQLRSLRWTFRGRDGRLERLSDARTNLAVDPATSTGAGLGASPGRALSLSVPGFVDYLDAAGAWVGTGITPVPGTVFVRRWSVTPLPEDAADSLVLQVRVWALRREPAAAAAVGGTAPGTLPDEAWLVTVLTRKAS